MVDFVGSPTAYYAMHGKHRTCCCILVSDNVGQATVNVKIRVQRYKRCFG